MSALTALDNFLDSAEADGGVRSIKARQLVCILKRVLDLVLCLLSGPRLFFFDANAYF